MRPMRCGAGMVRKLVWTVPPLDALGLGAEAIELMLVAEHGEAAEARRDLFLQLLELLIMKLHDEAALLADEVIVVLGIACHLVTRLAVAELTGGGQSAVGQQPERSIDRRISDPGMPAPPTREQLVDRDVALRAQEDLHDGLALLRRFQVLLAQEFRPLRPYRPGV